MGARPAQNSSMDPPQPTGVPQPVAVVLVLLLLGILGVAIHDVSDNQQPFTATPDITLRPTPQENAPPLSGDPEIPDFDAVNSYTPREIANLTDHSLDYVYGFDVSPSLSQPIQGIFLGELLSDAVERHGAERFHKVPSSRKQWGDYVYMTSSRPELYQSIRLRIWQGRIVEMSVRGLHEPDAFRDGLKSRFGKFDYRDWARPIMRVDGQVVSMDAVYLSSYELRLDQLWTRIDRDFKAARIEATRKLAE